MVKIYSHGLQITQLAKPRTPAPEQSSVRGAAGGRSPFFKKKRPTGARAHPYKKTLATLLLALFTASCVPGSTPPRNGYFGQTTLPPCSADGTMFSFIPFDFWPFVYHQLVDAAVTAHLTGFADQGSDSPFFANLQCNATDLAGLLQPSAPLFLIAAQLPPWQDPQTLSALSEKDFGAVLLEFLRVYECALKNQRTFIDLAVINDAPMFANLPLQWGAFGAERKRREEVIRRELLLARSALNRILSTTGSLDRLRPFLLDLECIERASLDLRNVMGLVSEASACMPRVWDARGSLRDPAPQ